MHSLLCSRAHGGSSSAIRDLLDQARRPGMISLAGGLPAATQFPLAQLADSAAEAIRSRGKRVLQYGVTQGESEARNALASLYDDGEPDKMVITTGSQQGLDLLARVLIDPGDIVVTGDPEYLGVLQVLRGYGAALHPIPVDADGLDTAVLAKQLATGLRPKACYLVPHFHNPTGATLHPDRRAQLHELSARYGFVVIEDDPYRELYYGANRPTEGNGDPDLTVRLRSTSKVLAPGLRLGVLDGPTWLTNAVVTAKQSVDLHTSTLSQAVVADALTSPWLSAHLDALRSSYGAKRDILTHALHDAFGDAIAFAAPAGGMFVWAAFARTDTTAWLTRALDNGVCFVPGAAFAVDRDMSEFARFSFVTASADDLHEAVARLHRCAP